MPLCSEDTDRAILPVMPQRPGERTYPPAATTGLVLNLALQFDDIVDLSEEEGTVRYSCRAGKRFHPPRDVEGWTDRQSIEAGDATVS